MTPNNPLKQYFRQPAIYIRLPSQGNFYPAGSIDMPPNGEIPVLPMTAVDEISYRTPDALFNGAAMVDVIQSCCPNIKNAWHVPAMDVDTLLVGIRLASYGHDMDTSSQCPKCNHQHDFTVDLRSVLDQIRLPDYDSCIQHGDLEFYFKPMTYKNLNENNQLQFEQQKIMSMLPESDLNDTDKVKNVSDALKRLTTITIQALCQGIAMIKTPNAMVSEPEFIQELMNNCDRKVFNSVRDHIVKLKTMAELQPLGLKCPECQHDYEQNITLDMTSFFEAAS
jgi:bacterioferritin-associated ferredoxin